MSVEIRLTNEIRVPRRGEWISRGVPFPAGTLRGVDSLRLRDEKGDDTPLAVEALAWWQDGSVKWALLQFPVHFEGHGQKPYSLDWGGIPPGRDEGPRIAVTKSGAGWEVDNGLLRFALPASGQAFVRDLRRGSEVCVREVRAEVVDEQGAVFVSELTGEPEVERLTEKMLVVSRRGVHRDREGRKLFSLVFRVTVFAGTDEAEVEYQFIHDEPYRDAPVHIRRLPGVGIPAVDEESPRARRLRGVRLVVAHGVGGASEFTTCPFGTAGNRGLISSPRPLRGLLKEGPQTAHYDVMIDAEVYDAGAVAGRSHGWVSAGDGRRGVAATVRKFVQQWPKGFQADGERIVLDLWPEEAGPLRLFQGQAKSHQVKVRAFEGSAAEARLPDWHFAYQFPVVLSAPEWFLDSGALGPVFRYQPKKYPGIEKKFRLEFDQYCAYYRLLGAMDYGDEEQLYDVVWGREHLMANCEHDFGQTIHLQFVRTGSFHYLDTFESSIRHVMDVDIIHFDDHFDEVGGWRTHGTHHVAADGRPNCTTSHMWAEGFLSYYYYCGYVPALNAARGVADLICRKVEAGEVRRGARDRGWPLIALCAVYRATGEARYAGAAQAIVASFVEGPDPLEANGGVSGGYGPIPCQQAVMGSVAATGLAYCHQTFGDGVSRGLFLRVCDFLASETPLSPEGLFLPMSGTETCMSFATFSCVRESIGYAWELTGDEKYLRAGLRDIEDYMVSTIPLAARPPVRIKNGYQVVVSTGNAISITWRDNLRFFCYADRAGLLRDF